MAGDIVDEGDERREEARGVTKRRVLLRNCPRKFFEREPSARMANVTDNNSCAPSGRRDSGRSQKGPLEGGEKKASEETLQRETT
jgi:hypothetical protein